MKVLYIIPGLGIGGGAERSLLDLAPGLRREGIELAIAYFHDRPTSAAGAFEQLGVEVHRVAATSLPGRVRAVRREIRAQRPDIVHTTLFEADVAGRLAAVGLPVRVVSSLVTTPYAPARRMDPAWSRGRMGAVRLVEAATLRLRTDAVHANSEAVRAAARRDLRVPDRKITVVPRGRAQVEVGAAAADRVRRDLDVADAVPLLVVVGRQEPTKGHADLLDALPRVLEVHPRAVVAFAGRPGMATEAIEASIERLALGDHVRRLGYRSDVAELLAAADLFVFPSHLEGMPGAVIEAMAASVPIVATTIAPVRELLDDDSALLVAPGEPGALAAAILEALGDPAGAQARAAVAHERYLASYTLDDALAGIVALYRQVLAS